MGQRIFAAESAPLARPATWSSATLLIPGGPASEFISNPVSKIVLTPHPPPPKLAACGGAAWHEMFADNVIEFSLPYLSNDIKDIGLRWPLRNMYPYVEFNYDQVITGPSGQTFPQLTSLPASPS